MMPSRCCIQYISKFGRPNSGHRIGKPIPILKKGNAKECVNHWTITFISHASKVMLKISHTRPKHYVNQEFYMAKLGLEKEEEQEIKLPTFAGSYRKQGNSRKKKIYLCFINYNKALDCVNHNKLWKALRKMGIPDHFTCLLRNLHVLKKQQLDLV